MHDQPKLCECGCGQPAPIASETRRKRGHVKGQPIRFIKGHHSRLQHGANNAAWRGAAATPKGIHKWLGKRFPKTGVCEKCGRRGKTDYAFLRHPAPHTRDRADYRELCRPCHQLLDEPLVGRIETMRESSR